MSTQAIIAFFLILHLRKKRRTLSPDAQWDRAFTTALYAIGILFILQSVFPVLEPVARLLWNTLLLLLLWVTYKNEVFGASRMLVLAILPIAIIGLLKDSIEALNAKWYESIDSYFDFADSIAITWLIALLLLSQRQQKALEKEHNKRREEEAANKLVAARKAELEVLVLERTAALTKQKEELEHALTELKTTQAQLVQSEKMASLGELTAGIAHEIQNPLNFVNNFSEVNKEMIDELQTELKVGNVSEAILISNDLKANEEKINYHGRRADAIVKGMLQHSRKNTGQKEATDLNALCDEYLRLSYHGLRAKDKSFNAAFKTDFDENIGKINIVPQDIGRVLLNIFNNAFYAVQAQKKKLEKDYQPMVSVSTRKLADKMEISVKDNGMGISKSLADKIFQPFFTTKPTGQGTGLGLSLSYDIVKAHGGNLTIESEEGEGATFTIHLPFQHNI